MTAATAAQQRVVVGAAPFTTVLAALPRFAGAPPAFVDPDSLHQRALPPTVRSADAEKRALWIAKVRLALC